MDMGETKNKVCIEMYDVITRGKIAELASVPPGVVGHVKGPNDEHVSEITAMIVVVNESCRDWPQRYRALENAGHDPMQVVEYYGKKTTVLEIIARCKTRSEQFFAANNN